MFFYREHLNGKKYEWPENKSGVNIPGRQLFDRLNGNHLLNMINFFGTSIGSFNISDGQKVERLLSELPVEVKSEIAVFNWLRGKYLYAWGEGLYNVK